MAKLRQNAGCYDYLNSGETELISGDVVVNGSLFGCVIRAIPAGKLGAVQVDGIWEFDIGTSETASVGAAAYWDASNKKITTTASTNAYAGVFTAAKESGETTCQIMINVGQPAASSGSGS